MKTATDSLSRNQFFASYFLDEDLGHITNDLDAGKKVTRYTKTSKCSESKSLKDLKVGYTKSWSRKFACKNKALGTCINIQDLLKAVGVTKLLLHMYYKSLE